MPRPLLLATALLIAISLLPAAYLAKSRVSSSGDPRIQVVYDMDSQPKAKSQRASEFFADGRVMRPQVEGTVAWGELNADSLVYAGRVDGEWVTKVPRRIEGEFITPEFVRRGRSRFDIYCAPCHGIAGRGDGLVSRHADALAEGTWTPPSDLTADAVRARSNGELFHFVSNGVRKMPGYARHLSAEDRWAVVMYVRALQLSVRGSIRDVPEEEQAALGEGE